MQRKRRLYLRQVVDALQHSRRTGCQLRNLPAPFPAWTAFDYYFRRWQQQRLWEQLN
ncbi:transposase [Hymenobacter negativus]|uniref:Transposase n=1 Tax=Hymenobacter negativus TaxID=2795026 RepID=A0ABS3QKR8_9BACT|nr:transposase [Hymenobacter negativus]MBO2011613.1 transposase [Hymenobacter negativus]